MQEKNPSPFSFVFRWQSAEEADGSTSPFEVKQSDYRHGALISTTGDQHRRCDGATKDKVAR
jgi:hypothetical protein